MCIREGGGGRRRGASDELIIIVRIQAIKQETKSVTGGLVEVGVEVEVCRLHS